MLLFSTILDINDTVTPDDFLRLVLRWNATSRYEENRVTGIEWHGEHSVRYGADGRRMEFVELLGKEIIAVRHEKVTEDGVAWDSDFIVNFAERRIAIQLDRTYNEDALVMDAAFSTPHFITLLIENGFLKDDLDIPVLRTPVMVTDGEMALCRRVFEEGKAYKLPVIYVTRTAEDTEPLSTAWLASRLKGAAHVLVEDSVDACREIRGAFIKTDDLYGAVRIKYPSGTTGRKKVFFRSMTGNAAVRLEKVIRSVIQYGISQRIDRLYTWQGVVGAALNEQLKHQVAIRMSAENDRQKAEAEVDKVYEEFDEDLRALQEKVEELTKANEALQYENQGLRAKYTSTEAAPILYGGDEEDFYQGEIRDMVLGTLDEALSATEKATRKADVLEDILDNNPYYRLSEERKQRVKSLFKGYKNLTGAMRQELLSLGFEISEAGKHYKITYRGDPRYMVTVGKTPSDNRSGSNNAALINKMML
jgi:hypothetical protein